ncbi:hypothetical protein E4U16_001736 [Claviceps sp. LM84 group G4]|nr:hypothetical protein E4U33_004307 [Claviceps sp. LM78 group G4]KAG6078300.1 hypothetical protein E4U16_001736 [Claviceps sp. LM84 group G4]
MARKSVACEQLYATLLLSDSYLPGALVLGHSLRDTGTKRKLAALVTLDSVSVGAVSQLKAVYDYILPVPRIRNERPANLALMNRLDLHSTFTKINLWKQVQFSKIVYLDADVLAYRAPDELFDLPHAFSAAPDVGWPDIANTGVMVLTPNMGDYHALLAMAERGVSFDGADQGLINMYFKHSINPLPFTYNVTPSTHYQYLPAYLHFQSSISMVHFIGANKPWISCRDSADQISDRWWAVHDRHYREQTSVSAMKQTPNRHEPNVIDVNAANAPVAGTPSIHTLNDQPKKNNENITLCQEEVGKYSPRCHQSNIPSRVRLVEYDTVQQNASSPTVGSSWDAQRQPPPLNSGPEAANLSSARYKMSRDTSPFVAPVRYPSPPRDMWYELPKQPSTSAGKPPQIFPWESKQPIPSRLFTEPVMDKPNRTSSAAKARESSAELAQDTSLTGSSSDSELPITCMSPRNSQEKVLQSSSTTTGYFKGDCLRRGY